MQRKIEIHKKMLRQLLISSPVVESGSKSIALDFRSGPVTEYETLI
jgi:hypothetical protein